MQVPQECGLHEGPGSRSVQAGARTLLGVTQRKGEEESGALPRLALGPDLPSMRLDDSLGDGEAKTGAHPGGVSRLPEALEDVWELFRRDSRSSVGHREPELARYGFRAHGDRSSFRSELDRIPDQIGEHPEDPVPVADKIHL